MTHFRLQVLAARAKEQAAADDPGPPPPLVTANQSWEVVDGVIVAAPPPAPPPLPELTGEFDYHSLRVEMRHLWCYLGTAPRSATFLLDEVLMVQVEPLPRGAKFGIARTHLAASGLW